MARSTADAHYEFFRTSITFVDKEVACHRMLTHNMLWLPYGMFHNNWHIVGAKCQLAFSSLTNHQQRLRYTEFDVIGVSNCRFCVNSINMLFCQPGTTAMCFRSHPLRQYNRIPAISNNRRLESRDVIM